MFYWSINTPTTTNRKYILIHTTAFTASRVLLIIPCEKCMPIGTVLCWRKGWESSVPLDMKPTCSNWLSLWQQHQVLIHTAGKLMLCHWKNLSRPVRWWGQLQETSDAETSSIMQLPSYTPSSSGSFTEFNMLVIIAL